MRILVRKLDALIRVSNHVFEFNTQADCVLRLQITRLTHELQLPDIFLDIGAPVLLIHLWNERLPTIPPGGPDLAWGKRMLRLFTHSLRLTATYLQSNPELSGIRAVGGVTILLTSGLHGTGARFMQEMGFTILPYSSKLGRFGEFWENFYSYMMVWAFNPGRLPDRSLFEIRRSEMWISREAFLHRYG